MKLILICEALNIKDTIPNDNFKDTEGKTFLDVLNYLLTHYRDSIGENTGEDYPIKFEGELENDTVPVNYSDYLKKWDGKKVHFFVEPIGGANPEFNQHAFKVIKNIKFSNWKSINPNNVSQGIYAVGRLLNSNQSCTFRIEPSNNYPDSPPLVTCKPSITINNWHNGNLHLCRWGSLIGSFYKNGTLSNPLIYLIESFQRDKISV